jgi:hypothetical protein
MEDGEITFYIRKDGMVVFNRQNKGLLDDTMELLFQINDNDDSIKEFLEGRKKISVIIGEEIFCG